MVFSCTRPGRRQDLLRQCRGARRSAGYKLRGAESSELETAEQTGFPQLARPVIVLNAPVQAGQLATEAGVFAKVSHWKKRAPTVPAIFKQLASCKPVRAVQD
jgi:hypothetical protein